MPDTYELRGIAMTLNIDTAQIITLAERALGNAQEAASRIFPNDPNRTMDDGEIHGLAILGVERALNDHEKREMSTPRSRHRARRAPQS